MPPGFSARYSSDMADSLSGISPSTVTRTALSNCSACRAPAPNGLEMSLMFSSPRSRALRPTIAVIASWASMATTSPRVPVATDSGIARRPGPHPASRMIMPGTTDRCSMIRFARFSRAKGLSNSTNQDNQAGHGRRKRLDALRHANHPRASAMVSAAATAVFITPSRARSTPTPNSGIGRCLCRLRPTDTILLLTSWVTRNAQPVRQVNSQAALAPVYVACSGNFLGVRCPLLAETWRGSGAPRRWPAKGRKAVLF